MQAPQNKIVILQYNIDAARREQQENKPAIERVERLFFQNRVPGIIQTINDSKANIVTLQELRDLDTSPIKANDFIHLTKAQTGLEVVGPYFYDKTVNSFALATFYDRKLFHVKNSGIISLPDSKKKEDKICLWVLFETMEGQTFIVANTHFAVSPEELKMESIEILFPALNKIKEQYNDCPLVVNGDFNFFDDFDGFVHRSYIITKFQMYDALHPLCMSKDNDERLSGTFIGYPEVDAFHKKPDNMSRLDHGFVFCQLRFTMALKPLGHAYTVGVTNENLKTAQLPSDHLPCVREYVLSDEI